MEEKMTETGTQDRMPGSLRELLSRLDAQGITDSRRYGEVRRFLSFKAREKGLPISGCFELTPLCNLDCKMCYVHLKSEQMHGARLRTADEWRDIMRQAFDAGMMFAALTGGECLTYPGFWELYGFLRERGVEVTILSNGLLMDEETVERFRNNPPALIQVTVYGASEEAYERVTGVRAFARVLGGLRRIRDAGLPVRAAVTPNAYMTDGEALLRRLADEGIPFSVNNGLVRPREETGRGLADADLDVYVDILKRARALRGEEAEPECAPESLPELGAAAREPKRGVRCGAGRSGFAVDWRGVMKPCNTFPCAGEDVCALGFAEAWRRTNRTALDFPTPAECVGCAYEGVCKHCAAEHASGAPIGHACAGVCAWSRRMMAEGLLKSRQPLHKNGFSKPKEENFL